MVRERVDLVVFDWYRQSLYALAKGLCPFSEPSRPWREERYDDFNLSGHPMATSKITLGFTLNLYVLPSLLYINLLKYLYDFESPKIIIIIYLEI